MKSGFRGTLVASLILGPLALAPMAFGAVKLFHPGQAAVVIEEDLQLTMPSGPGKKFNRGTAAQEVVRYVSRHRAEIGIRQGADGESLPFQRAVRSADGISLRFTQRYHRVSIEDAELVAIHDARGRLLALNSSLVEPPSITVNPSLHSEREREAALAAAVSQLGYKKPEIGKGRNDGLLIVDAQIGQPRLVWQFSLREKKDGSRPLQIQIAAQGPDAGKVVRVLPVSQEATDVSIYDASVTVIVPNPLFKGVQVLRNGKPTFLGRRFVGAEALDANQSFTQVLDFYEKTFGRLSFDAKSAQVNASINAQKYGLDPLGLKQNAAWMGPWKMFVFGAGGDELGSFTSSLDVVGHEFTHAVIGSTSDLKYEGQSGALNEHLADFFGAMIQSHYEPESNPWLLGEKTLRGELAKKAEALRDMMTPSLGLKPQPAKMSEIKPEFGKDCQPAQDNDNCGVHTLSGIPNRISALIVEALGWSRVSPLFYRVATQRLRSSSQFADYREQVLDECAATLTAPDCEVMKSAFAQAEL